ncbi:hypothetical protein DVA86_16730 [Streptomyces armeniacus]|uniref:Uncharacterized protein n=1 Tax=Streptomyces armeniacus TaxID=83291 RepID=A0A345XQZ5_9ACTN|nr:hypothetical protein DVA86_16730 [Streptomyces armeniacus]
MYPYGPDEHIGATGVFGRAGSYASGTGAAVSPGVSPGWKDHHMVMCDYFSAPDDDTAVRVDAAPCTRTGRMNTSGPPVSSDGRARTPQARAPLSVPVSVPGGRITTW